MYRHMHTLILNLYCIPVYTTPRLCYFCAHSTMYTVKVACMRGQVQAQLQVHSMRRCVCVRACTALLLSSLVNSRLTTAVSSLILVIAALSLR